MSSCGLLPFPLHRICVNPLPGHYDFPIYRATPPTLTQEQPHSWNLNPSHNPLPSSLSSHSLAASNNGSGEIRPLSFMTGVQGSSTTTNQQSSSLQQMHKKHFHEKPGSARMDAPSIGKSRHASTEYHPYPQPTSRSQVHPHPRRLSTSYSNSTSPQDISRLPTPSSPPQRLPSIRYPLSQTTAGLSNIDSAEPLSPSSANIPSISSLLTSNVSADILGSQRSSSSDNHRNLSISSMQSSNSSSHITRCASFPAINTSYANGRSSPTVAATAITTAATTAALASSSPRWSSPHIANGSTGSAPLVGMQRTDSRSSTIMSQQHSHSQQPLPHSSRQPTPLKKQSTMSPYSSFYPQYSQQRQHSRYNSDSLVAELGSSPSAPSKTFPSHMVIPGVPGTTVDADGCSDTTVTHGYPKHHHSHQIVSHAVRSSPTSTPAAVKAKDDCPKRKIAMVKFASPSATVPEQIEILIKIVEEEPTLKWVLERRSSMSSLVSGGCKTWITQCLRPILNCYYNCHSGDMANFTRTYRSRLVAKRFKEAGGCFCNQ
ncbi:hypothetical protein BSLG_010002 [Batrachochytrium salamandrivorans]|nr:hypothetical protein BASA60_007278 [Batrachochytrium salamandrivorans]KAJ1328771.1 hypothetical protein BSLG_010002 [Batrachochytrium salamandrivorans]